MDMVTTEIIHDGLGDKRFKVARIFPNVESAARAARLLASLMLEAEEPPPAIDEPLPIPEQPFPDPEQEDDTGEPYTVPGCATGVCGMD